MRYGADTAMGVGMTVRGSAWRADCLQALVLSGGATQSILRHDSSRPREGKEAQRHRPDPRRVPEHGAANRAGVRD
jgi:hypothetical protein